MNPADTPLTPGLQSLKSGSDTGEIGDITRFAPDIALRADPALGARGHWRSPPGRLLELEMRPGAVGGRWIALHLTLETLDFGAYDWFGLTCHSAGRNDVMVRPCLRSGCDDGRDDGFEDCFFDRHLLATPEPRAYVDALHIATRPRIPDTAPWRELVLFLPHTGFTWHLHDLRLFLL